MLPKKLLISIIPLVLTALLILVGCTPGGTTSVGITPGTTQEAAGVSSSDSKLYKPAWITPEISGEQVSMLLNDVTGSKMAHFWITLPSGKESFMAYRLDGVTYVRANICPPCRSTSFSLEKGILVCDTCGTRFNAKTGQGISGACVNYPKAEVAAELKDGKLLMTQAGLVAAYAETLKIG
jgi:nitrite reductase/ring-hydroxylating ferredoxin subunit